MTSVAETFNFSCIDEHICGFAYPRTDEQFAFLKSQGIAKIISLSADPAPESLAKKYGLKVIHLPILDFGIPTEHIVKKFFQEVDEAISNNHKLGVHCLYGQGRTGLMLSLYLVKYKGFDSKSALKHLRSLRPKSVESRVQLHFLNQFDPKIWN